MEECLQTSKLLTDQVDDAIPGTRHKPLPLGGEPGQMKAAYYPENVGLEQLLPEIIRIHEEECKYDITAMYGILLIGGFKRQRFTLTNSHLKDTVEISPHGSRGSSKGEDGDPPRFQWSQFTTQCSLLMFPSKDRTLMTRPTTQLPQPLDK
ncbi:hypothetical protein Tco_0517897 [Tanacetum coccineum]